LENHLKRLVDQDPLEHGSIHSQWSCHELATVLAHQTGIQLGRESVRCILKKYAKLLPSPWTARSHPGRPRLWLCRPGCPGVPRAPG
jgi:hypothetical protein